MRILLFSNYKLSNQNGVMAMVGTKLPLPSPRRARHALCHRCQPLPLRHCHGPLSGNSPNPSPLPPPGCDFKH